MGEDRGWYSVRIEGWGRGKWMREEREVGEIWGNYATMHNLEAKKTGALLKGIAKLKLRYSYALA